MNWNQSMKMFKIKTTNIFSLISFSLLVYIIIFIPSEAIANNQDRPTVIVRPSVVIQGDSITLGEIGSINASSKKAQALANELRGIKISDAPPPSGSISLIGVQILETIENAGFDSDSFGYSIPKQVTVQRDGRVITPQEVLSATQQELQNNKTFDLQVRDVSWPTPHIIPVGATRFKIQLFGDPVQGRAPIRVEAFVNEKPEARFMATAIVDDWRAVPVLNRNLDRGMLIQPEDVQLVRLNVSTQPDDIADKVNDVVGRAAKSRISAGETIRRRLIDIPPTIPKGKRITVLYNNNNLTATATAIAIEDGFEGSIIRVRNDDSKRVIEGTVISPEEVQVGG
jgi:flagellar basal body P-ring formation protein FlgA